MPTKMIIASEGIGNSYFGQFELKKYMMKKQLLTSIFLLIFLSVQAQEAVSSGGGFDDTGEISVSWTIGEIFTEALSSEDVLLTQGQQQPGLKIINGVEKNQLDYSISAYPNPTPDFLALAVLGTNDRDLTFAIYNASGVVVRNQEPLRNNASVSMAEFPAGIYIIAIHNRNETVKSFKVIKK